MANVNWSMEYTAPGMLGVMWLTATCCVSLRQSSPANQSLSVPPMKGANAELPGVKASE